jgi:uncharacterized protein (DUF1330 family)
VPIEPSSTQLEQFVSGPDDKPIEMLNLLRFKERADGVDADDGISGAEAYARYGAAIGGHLERVGAQVVWAGACNPALIGPDDPEWDMALVVRYPSRAAFLSMVQDPDYLAQARHRTAALADSRLIPSYPPERV